MNSTTSRHALTGEAGIAAIIATTPPTSSASNSAAPGRRWDELVAAYDRADAVMRATGAEHDAKSNIYSAECKTLGPQPIAPRVEYPRTIVDMTVGELMALDRSEPTVEAQTSYRAACAAWAAQKDEIDERTMGDVDERWEAAVDNQNDAALAVFAHPAPDAAALLFKLALAEREYRMCDLDEKVTAQIFADVRRLVGQEG